MGGIAADDYQTTHQGSVHTLRILTTDDNGEMTLTTVSDQNKIYRILVQRNTAKLGISDQFSFTTGPIAIAICTFGDNAIVDRILDGSGTHESLGLSPDQGR